MTNGVPPMPVGPTGPPIGIHGPERSYSVDIIVCSVITSVIGTAFVGLRFYTRAVLRRVLGLEDWLILIAQIFSIATAACFIQEAVLGLGEHWWWMDPSNVMPMGRAGWIAILFYELSLWFSQTAILVLYLRIWTHPWMKRCTWALIAIITAYNIFVFVSIFTACIPLEAYWDFTVRASHCHPISVWLANTYLHIATDFLIYFLPMPIIFRLTLPRQQKALVFVLFAFGFFVCMISVIRLVYLLMTLHTTDIPYDNTTTAFWTTIETNATVVIACIMTMKPLFSKWFPSLTQLRSGEMQDANGRVPTIGSTPTRPPNAGSSEPLSLNPFGTTFAELEGGGSGRVETDLEATGRLDSGSSSGDLEKAPSRVMAERAPSISQECLYRDPEDRGPGPTQR